MSNKKSNKPVVHRGAVVTETEREEVMQPETNRAAYLAANPEAKRVHEAHIARFTAGYHGWQGATAFAAAIQRIRQNPKMDMAAVESEITRALPLRLTARAFVLKADDVRDLGNILIEWQETLPGRKFTRDFYEQHKAEFTDEAGLVIPFEQLEWLMRVARSEQSPVDDLLTAWKCRQPMLLALGLEDAERPPGKPVAPSDPLTQLQEIFNPAEIAERWTAFKNNPRYCPNGVLRDEWREMLAEQWKPAFKMVDEVKAALGV